MALSTMTGEQMRLAIDAMKKTLDDGRVKIDIGLKIAADHNVRRKLDMIEAAKQLYTWKSGLGTTPTMKASEIFNPHIGADSTNIYYFFKELRRGMPWEIRRDLLVEPIALTLLLFDILNKLFPCPVVTRGMITLGGFINLITRPKFRPYDSPEESRYKHDRYLREMEDYEKSFTDLYSNLSTFFAEIETPERNPVTKAIKETRSAAKKIEKKVCGEDKPACFVAQEKAFKIWKEYKCNVEVKNRFTRKDHRITYSDVFVFCKKQLTALGFKTTAQFKNACESALKRAKRTK